MLHIYRYIVHGLQIYFATCNDFNGYLIIATKRQLDLRKLDLGATASRLCYSSR